MRKKKAREPKKIAKTARKLRGGERERERDDLVTKGGGGFSGILAIFGLRSYTPEV